MAGSSQDQRAMLELFEEALELPEGEQRDFITNNAPSDSVRDGALSLLARHGDAQSALRTGAPGALGSIDDDLSAPERLGQYRIVGPIGRGGMGVVYHGERDVGDFDRRVAIKIVRPGILSDDLVARFLRERQILASLDHPHIARLYDGGQTEEGAPFLVMEYVDGRSLSAWLKEAEPDLAARLTLMLQICAAVEYAHQNLVVHRDLTPSNVLVSDSGEAKLIDFGIARPQESGETGQTVSPLSGLSLTPGFAAPERQSGGAVTTLTDIYSLGQIMVLMLEPFDEPELAAIADKACAPQPADRYSGAALMAQDIERFSSRRAVNAFSQAPSYRLRKYLQRNIVPVALAGLAAVSMLAGLVLVTDAYRDEARARADAEARFDEVRELSNFLLFDLYDELEDVPGATKALNDIADRARHYLDVLSNSEGADDEVRLEAALAYKRLSDVLGTPIAANLGRREEAGETLDLAISQLRHLNARKPNDEAIERGLAEALYSQAVFAFIALDDNDLANKAASESAQIYWRLAQSHDAEKYGALAIDAEIEAAQPLAWMGKGAQAVDMLKATLAKMEAHKASYGDTPGNLGLYARCLSNLSEVIGRLADSEEAEYGEAVRYGDRAIAAYRRFVRVAERPDGARRSMAIALYKRSLNLYSMDQLDRALDDLDEAIGILEAQARLDPEDAGLAGSLAAFREQQAITLAYDGQGDRALALARQSSAEKRAQYRADTNNPGNARDYASNLVLVGEVAEIVGQRGEACSTYRNAAAMFAAADRLQPLSQFDREVVMGDLDGAIERTC